MEMESIYSGGQETKAQAVQIVNEPTDDPQYLYNLNRPERDFGKQAQAWRRD